MQEKRRFIQVITGPRQVGKTTAIQQVLAEIKNDSCLNSIPIIVLTTSNSDEDVLQSYNLRANCYITKPVDLEQFMAVIKTMQEFWLSIVKLPPHVP